MRWIRAAAALPICVLGLLLPYGPRLRYANLLAAAAHAPFLLFGWAARKLLGELRD